MNIFTRKRRKIAQYANITNLLIAHFLGTKWLEHERFFRKHNRYENYVIHSMFVAFIHTQPRSNRNDGKKPKQSG